MHKKRGTHGFTLIELLVVISIISLLASIVFASLNSARTKARDVRRKADLSQIVLANELYFDTNNQYAPDGGWCDSSKNITAVNCSGFGSNVWPAGGLSSVEGMFIPNLPVDPLNNSDFYYYYEPVSGGQMQFGLDCRPNGTTCGYIISARLENNSDQNMISGCNNCVPDRNYCKAGGGAIMGTSC
ncbi:MAG: type II secretion system protein [Candidatus Sungbacteria bacterium]|nr:type II secretion system protein [Candidatus Sungbacteria bacterium]